MVPTEAALTDATEVIGGVNGNGNCNTNKEGIAVSNLTDGETLVHSLALIRGHAPTGCDRITLRQRTKNVVSEWPVHAGEFRSVVELARGDNVLVIETPCGARRRLLLRHEPRTGSRERVTPVYVICAGDDGRFQAPSDEDRSVESAAARIGLGARLLQTLTAEKLLEAGHGRRTFQLERDLDGAECLVMRSVLDVDRARSTPQRELWELIARELMTGPLASRDRKYLAFLSCTRYRGGPPTPTSHAEVLARTEGHAAIGGGGLALFGTGCLYTWPDSPRQILSRFADARRVDRERFMDDSDYRSTRAGCLATTLGSVLHELGHAFDLGHASNGIMSRGFDDVDRVFVGAASAGIDVNRNPIRHDPQHTTIALSRPLSVTVTVRRSNNGNTPTKRIRRRSETPRSATSAHSSPSPVCPGRLSAPASPDLERTALASRNVTTTEMTSRTDRTFWSPSCAAILAYHRWFNSSSETGNQPRNGISDIRYDAKRNVVRSRNGVRVIELRESSGEMVVCSRVFPGARPTLEVLVPLPPPHCLVPLTLVAEDTAGNLLKHPMPVAF